MIADQAIKDVPVTASGIPIRNVWHMLLYAWNEYRPGQRLKAETQSAPSLDALFALVLSDLMQQRFRIGLGRDYRTSSMLIRGVRGRVDFATSIERLAFQHGQAQCEFQSYGPNVRKNQVIRSTLHRLAQRGDFGPSLKRAEELRHRVQRIVRALEMVDLIDLNPAVVRREQLQRHDSDYRLMLAVCHLVWQREMPTDATGNHDLAGLDRDSMTLWRVFERFVANFYAGRLSGWTVKAQAGLKWHESRTSQFLPAMCADLLLRESATKRTIVLDTKFTKNILVGGRVDNLIFNRDHLFQMYAYLRSQDDVSEHFRRATGILLYPTVKFGISDVVEMQGHCIRWETIDLSQEWSEIERELLAKIV